MPRPEDYTQAYPVGQPEALREPQKASRSHLAHTLVLLTGGFGAMMVLGLYLLVITV